MFHSVLLTCFYISPLHFSSPLIGSVRVAAATAYGTLFIFVWYTFLFWYVTLMWYVYHLF